MHYLNNPQLVSVSAIVGLIPVCRHCSGAWVWKWGAVFSQSHPVFINFLFMSLISGMPLAFVFLIFHQCSHKVWPKPRVSAWDPFPWVLMIMLVQDLSFAHPSSLLTCQTSCPMTPSSLLLVNVGGAPGPWGSTQRDMVVPTGHKWERGDGGVTALLLRVSK